jgi:hypothetical protein
VIKKAKIKDGGIIINLVEVDSKANVEREMSVKSLDDRLHPDLTAAFSALENTVRVILELPSNWRQGCMTISGVSWAESEGTGVTGATITAQVALETCNSPLILNTPFLPFEQYNEGGEAPLMPQDGIDALENLRSGIEAFISGKRAQASFDFMRAA